MIVAVALALVAWRPLAVHVPAVAQDLHAPFTVAPGTPLVPPGATNVTVALRLQLPVESVEVLRLGRSSTDRRWQVAEFGRRNILNGAVTVQAPAGLESIVVVRVPEQDGYLLDGPFRWPDRPSAYSVPVRWRLTVRGGWPRNGAAAPVWVTADLRSDPSQAWPQCAWTSEDRWECVGVPIDAAGVVVSSARADIAYAIAAPGRAPGGIEEAAAAAAPWGRLVAAAVTGSPAEALANVTLTVRRVELPRARPQAIRVQAMPDTSVRVERLSAAAFWLAGAEVNQDSWIEVSAATRAPTRIPLRQVAGEPSEFVFRVDLDPALGLFGRVTAGAGMPASGAAVSIFRLVPDPALPEKRPPKHLLVAEQTTGDDGVFRFDGLSMERYELLALHAALGRAQRWVEPDGQEIEIALERPVQAIGRVLRGGEPAPGVLIRVLPDLAQFASAEDVTELSGGETRSDSEGRFAVALSRRGGEELRIGGGADAVRRVPLPAGDGRPGVVDIGDVEIGGDQPVMFVFEGSGGCDLMLAGPQGRAGLTVVRATRTGPAMFEARLPEPGRWSVMASCGGRERAVAPAIVEVKPSGTDLLRLSWPR